MRLTKLHVAIVANISPAAADKFLLPGYIFIILRCICLVLFRNSLGCSERNGNRVGPGVSMVFLGYLRGASMASRAGVLSPSPESGP